MITLKFERGGLTRILKIGVKMLSSRKGQCFTILLYRWQMNIHLPPVLYWDFSKSWSQSQKVGVKYSKFGVPENSEKNANGMANSVDPDLSLHCLPRPVCPKTQDHYCKQEPLCNTIVETAVKLLSTCIGTYTCRSKQTLLTAIRQTPERTIWTRSTLSRILPAYFGNI